MKQIVEDQWATHANKANLNQPYSPFHTHCPILYFTVDFHMPCTIILLKISHVLIHHAKIFMKHRISQKDH